MLNAYQSWKYRGYWIDRRGNYADIYNDGGMCIFDSREEGIKTYMRNKELEAIVDQDIASRQPLPIPPSVKRLVYSVYLTSDGGRTFSRVTIRSRKNKKITKTKKGKPA